VENAYTQNHKWALQKFKELMVQKNLSQNSAAKMVGVSASAISQIIKGNYKADPANILNDLYDYFKLKEQNASDPAQNRSYVPTAVSERIYNQLRACRLSGGLAVAYGDSGVGKTQAARKFAKDFANYTILVTARSCHNNITAVMRLLARALGVNERTADEMEAGILAKLRDGTIIILDEAQHLSARVLDSVRQLSDEFEEQGQTLGVALIGNDEIYRTLHGKDKTKCAQIRNRIYSGMVRYTVDHIKKEDINLLFPDLSDQKPESDFLFKLSKTPLALRGADRIYKNASRAKDKSYAGLQAAYQAAQLIG